jgi:hypothetical protein
VSERWLPKLGDEYFVYSLAQERAVQLQWKDEYLDKEFYCRGLAHPTKEAAEAWGAAQGETK